MLAGFLIVIFSGRVILTFCVVLNDIVSLEQCDYSTIQEENGSISEYECEHVALVHVRSPSEKFVCDSAYSAGHSVSLSLLTRLNSCFDYDATAQHGHNIVFTTLGRQPRMESSVDGEYAP